MQCVPAYLASACEGIPRRAKDVCSNSYRCYFNAQLHSNDLPCSCTRWVEMGETWQDREVHKHSSSSVDMLPITIPTELMCWLCASGFHFRSIPRSDNKVYILVNKYNFASLLFLLTLIEKLGDIQRPCRRSLSSCCCLPDQRCVGLHHRPPRRRELCEQPSQQPALPVPYPGNSEEASLR